MGGQGCGRPWASPELADPPLAPLPGVSELPSQVSWLCCSWKVLVVLLQGLTLPGWLCTVTCHRTAAESPRAKKVTFLSWILYW